MAKSNDRENGSNVISLDAFRAHMESVQEPATGVGPYQAADYSEFHTVKYLLGQLGANQSSFGLIIREGRPHASSVLETQNVNGVERLFALTLNKDDEEEMLLELVNQSEDVAERLRKPLGRYYTAAYIAHHMLLAHKMLNTKAVIDPPKVDEEVIHLEGERLRKVTAWRVASGLGVIAAAHKRPELQGGMKDYLTHVLQWQHQYVMNMANFEVWTMAGLPIWDIMRQKPPTDGSKVSDRVLGLGTPLEGLQLRQAFNKLR